MDRGGRGQDKATLRIPNACFPKKPRKSLANRVRAKNWDHLVIWYRVIKSETMQAASRRLSGDSNLLRHDFPSPLGNVAALVVGVASHQPEHEPTQHQCAECEKRVADHTQPA